MFRAFNSLYRYSESLRKHPVYTKMMSIGVIYFTADVLCQTLVEGKRYRNYSSGRTLRHCVNGAFFVAPTLHVWHSKVIPALTFGFKNRYKRILAAYLLGELVFAPLFIASLLFLYEADRAKSTDAGFQNVKEKFKPTLIAYYKHWTLVSLLTYSVVPIPYRPIFTSLYGINWQMYISQVAGKKVASPSPSTTSTSSNNTLRSAH